jgi:hypothetical protein
VDGSFDDLLPQARKFPLHDAAQALQCSRQARFDRTRRNIQRLSGVYSRTGRNLPPPSQRRQVTAERTAPVVTLVASYLQQPGAQRSGGVKAVKRPKRPDEDLLGHIFGVVSVAQQQVGQAKAASSPWLAWVICSVSVT